MGSGVGWGIRPRQIVFAFSLIALAVLGFLLAATRFTSPVTNTQSALVPAAPLAKGIASRRSLEDEWKSSASLFHNHPRSQKTKTTTPDPMQGIATASDTSLPHGQPDTVPEVRQYVREEPIGNALRIAPAALSTRAPGNPAIIHPTPVVPPALRAEFSRWRTTEPLSVTRVNEQRQQIASGEKIVKRARVSEQGPLDEARKRAVKRAEGAIVR